MPPATVTSGRTHAQARVNPVRRPSDNARVRWIQQARAHRREVVTALLGVILSTAVVGGAVAGIAVWISGGSFDWTLAAAAATAFGTTALAVATGALALETLANVRATQQDVAATGKLVELAERDQVERDRPIVVLEGLEVTDPGIAGVVANKTDGSQTGLASGAFRYRFLNVGVGPALDLGFRIDYTDPSVRITFKPPVLRRRVLVSGGEWKEGVEFSLEGPVGSFFNERHLRLVGGYLDRTQTHAGELVVIDG